MKKPIVIFDTDMDTDCDDAGALLMLINAHLAGNITLLGVVADSFCAHAAPFCKGVLDYCGVSVPLGEVYGHVEPQEEHLPYLEHQNACADVAYNKMLSERNGELESATELYKNLLTQAQDKSVTVLCVGLLTAISKVVEEDTALFEKKVEKVVLMGNPYKKNDFNLGMDYKSTERFFDLCPSPIYVSYLGREIITGNYLHNTLPPNHPVRRAYEIWSDGKGRASWDLIAALYAINPDSELFNVQERGRISYLSEEKISVIDKSGTRDTVIGLNSTNEEMENLLNSLLG